MNNATPILVPLENVNDPTILLTAWLVKDGEEVREGQVIAEMETSKAVIEFPSPASGTISLRARAGAHLEVGAVIGYVGAGVAAAGHNGAGRAGREVASAHAMVFADASQPATPSGVRFSNKALEVIQRYGVPPQLFAGRTMVREMDVISVLKDLKSSESVAAGFPSHLRSISLNGVTLPKELSISQKGTLDPEFFAHISKRAPAFGRLSSARKCREYEKNGAFIGADVRIGEETAIVAPRIVLNDGVEIGDRGDIRCRDSFSVGTLSSFRDGLVVRGGTVAVGECVYAGSRIQIGGGGNADPWSLLSVGDNSFLGDDLFINICRPVLIGREVFLTQRAMLVTHNIGHSVLEGYENCFEPIVLEDRCQVGMASTLYAGVRIGRSAIVGSNSYVISSIPEGKFAMGVPARVVRDAVRPIDRATQLRIARTMVREFRDLLKLKGLDVSEVSEDRFTLARGPQRYELKFAETLTGAHAAEESDRSRVFWVMDNDGPVPAGATVFSLLEKTVNGAANIFADSAREFLRKRGIRFQSGPWRYRRGLI